MRAELVESAQAARAAQGIDTATPVAQVLVEWRHTAEIYADPELLAELTRDRDGDAGPVPCPRPGDGQEQDPFR
ncbi:hypothetical protein [Streptomyces sp. TS71-3]|uniref:hypothetical protein n=1 Tax=Streptomyces sp. TS71-3 TaxID=2733862 RepID=UPI001BB38C44|nr:hypothetical protein [Streptomyces sp. TS71-3]